jgi:Asp/Glu/hydantoin racemase
MASPARAPIILLARIVLLNPNTTVALTDLMVEIARKVAAAGHSVEGLTAPFRPPLITSDLELDRAARLVLSLAPVLGQRAVAVIVSAVGDPAADTLAEPVIGNTEAALRLAVDSASFRSPTHT